MRWKSAGSAAAVTLRRRCAQDPVKLGPREREVLKVLLTGANNQKIAQVLGMAKRTVKAHFNRLFLKFGISGGVKRVKLAIVVQRQREQLLGCESPLPDLDTGQLERSAELLIANPSCKPPQAMGEHVRKSLYVKT
jgi:DNA-binding CsgD family transcriptional regulator